MRIIKLIIIWVLLAGLMSACSNFLNVTPKNVISMDDLPSVKQALGGYMAGLRDDMSGVNGNTCPRSPFVSSQFSEFVPYTDEWDLSSFADNDMTDDEIRQADWRRESTAYYWSSYYSIIGFMNLILYEAETAEGEESMRDYLMGEAYVNRAYCFFKLVQYYAPYDNNELGVPICLDTYEDFENVSVKRHTQREVYTQILSDLEQAAIRIERTAPRAEYNVLYSESVINRLYAIVYHFKALSAAADSDDWDNAIKYASRETDGKTLCADPDVLKQIFDFAQATVDYNPETSVRVGNSGAGNIYGYNVNQEFLDNYFREEDDIRKELYFNITTDWMGISKLSMNKYNNVSWLAWYYRYNAFRLSEIFLIHAEALVRTDQVEEARKLLRRFKEARYTENVVVPDGKDAVLADILRERRKEFVAEGDIVWMDMKRLGVKMERTVAGVTYKLNGAGDYRYTFPIPNSELENNKEMKEQNPGWILND